MARMDDGAVKFDPLKLSIIVAAHNEERYISRCLEAIEQAVEGIEHEVIVICDRCTDRTTQEARRFPVIVIEKDQALWRNSYAENLEIGLKQAHGEFIAVVDSDIRVEKSYFRKVLAAFDNDIVSVSGKVETERSTLFNRIYSLWEKTYDTIGAGREPRGGNRIYRGDILRKVRFSDTIAPDTDVDLRMGGRKIYLREAISYHMRELSFGKCIRGQIKSGRARRQLRIPIWRTILHSLVRLRPFVAIGYIAEYYVKRTEQIGRHGS
jgi:glycosyltransferase involved in cell wall biosynthesis